MLSRPSAVALLAFPLAACASPSSGPPPPPPTRTVVRTVDFRSAEFFHEKDQISTTLAAGAADAWTALPGVYEELRIPVTQRLSEEMTLGNPAFQTRSIQGRRMGSYVDCGSSLSGPLANVYEVTLSLATRVADAPEGGAVLTTVMEAVASPRVTRGNPVRCRSKGTLEERIAEILREKVGRIK